MMEREIAEITINDLQENMKRAKLARYAFN
jgi:hypothetical protein